MKKILTTLFIGCCFRNAQAGSNLNCKPLTSVDTAAYPLSKLSQVNTTAFIGLTINNFLANLDSLVPGYVLSRVYGLDGRRLATRLRVYFQNGMAFTIVVQKTEYVTQFNEDSQWDINLFRQENISRIEFHNADTCISGCPN